MLILQIIGGIVLVILAIIMIFYLYLRFVFGKYLHLQPQVEPLKIHLTEDIEPNWLNHKKAKKITKELQEIGFTQGKAFSIEEIPDMLLVHFYKNHIHAVLYKHRIVGFWVDFSIKVADNDYYYTTNAPLGDEIDMPPNMFKFYDKNASLQQLYNKIEELTKDKEVVYVPVEDFRNYCETIYKEQMSWKVKRGGVSFAEFKKISDGIKRKNFSDKELKEAFLEHKLMDLNSWHVYAIEEFAETLGTKDNYDEISRLMCDSFIVPFTTYAPAFIEYLTQWGVITEEQGKQLKKRYENETDIYQVFEEINGLFSEENRAIMIAEQDFPLPLKIYTRSHTNYRLLERQYLTQQRIK